MAWNPTSLSPLFNPTEAAGVPYPVAGQQATGSQNSLSASQTGLSVTAAGTVSSTNFSLGSATFRNCAALVFLTAGAGTSTVQVLLQASSSSSFASDVVNVDSQFINANVAGQLYSLTLRGGLYDTARQFWRVTFTTGAGTSFTADIGLLAV